MTAHLNEDQQITALIGAPGSEIERHLDTCAECSRALEELRQEFSDVRQELTAFAGRDEFFWRRQQLEIQRRAQSNHQPPVLLRWVAAVAVLATAAAMLVGSGQQRSVPPAQIVQTDTDYQLLVAVEQDLARPVPLALEPANVLASDLDNAWRARAGGANSRSKLSENANRRR